MPLKNTESRDDSDHSVLKHIVHHRVSDVSMTHAALAAMRLKPHDFGHELMRQSLDRTLFRSPGLAHD